ncbi:DNA polymerase III subunit gamma and tau, partial [Streptomyces sp. ME02-6991-2B]|nr:DNA polymerase III subunit gamma and tau [Streptomyces sp. ME02-6991-2B]
APPPTSPSPPPAAAAARAAVGAAPAASAYPPVVDEPPPVEYDMPEDDDPDLDETALSGHDLIVRELGATVIEEIAND